MALGLKPDAGAVDHDLVMNGARPYSQYFAGRCHVTAHGESLHLLAILSNLSSQADE